MPQPEWRNKLLPQIVDYRAENTPDLLYAEYPISSTSYDHGFAKYTYRDLANAINGIAWWFQNSLGPGNFETLAYIGPNDIRVPALIVGAIKAGYVIFPTSPRNSIPAQFHLLAQANCSTLISSTPPSPAVTAILKTPNHNLNQLEIPSIEKLIGEVQPYFPYSKIYENVSLEPFCILHTSGSTGVPKILVMTHAWAMGNFEMMAKEPPPGFENVCRLWQGNRVFAVFPAFHAMYQGAFLFNPVAFGTVMIAPIAGAPPTAEGVVEALKHSDPPFDAAFLLPSIVRELSQSPKLLEYCAKHLKVIFSAGGDLPQDVGNIIASQIQLANHYGSSETGLFTLLLPKEPKRLREEWKYLQFDESLGCEFRQYNENEFELYVKRDSAISRYQSVFGMFPNTSEYRTRDLFIQHPTQQDLWKWSARADDIIIFLTGEKTNPISMEQYILSRHDNILSLLVAGAQRFQTALLIHPAQDLVTVKDKAAFIENIWPSIEEANHECPAHAKIEKSHILFTDPSKPMLWSGKGTIQRAATLALYAKELDKLYEDAGKMLAVTNNSKYKIDLSMENYQGLSSYTKESVSSITNWEDLQDSDDFFSLGMDSLQAIQLVRKFRQDLALPSISTSTIYTNPNVAALSRAVVKLSGSLKASEISEKESREQTTKDIIEEYQGLIKQVPLNAKFSTSSRDKHVVLTGSTGALGSYILHALLDDPTVAHVWCLNRGSDILERQRKRNEKAGLPIDLPASRVTLMSSNLSEPMLGLQESTYTQLQESTTQIIHNAWPVNFKLNTQTYRPHFAGLVNLIQLATTAKNKTHLMFISSIGAILNANPTGYTESKQISEILLTYASKHLTEVTPSERPSLSIVRVGQVAGAVNYQGLWSIGEWFPTIILSSIHLGVLPDSLGALGNIDWVPVDILGHVLIELSFAATDDRKIPIFHPSNPHTTTYEALLPAIISSVSQHAGNSKPLVPVPPAQWIEKVRKDIEVIAGSNSKLKEGELEELLKQNPAAKLLDFYDDMLITPAANSVKDEYLEEMKQGIRQSLTTSKHLRELGAVKEEWLSKWVGEWISGTGIEGVH